MKIKCLALSILLAVLAHTGWARTPGEIFPGGVLREAQLHGLSVPDRKLSTFRGKPLLINVWASWCGPCRMEIDSIEHLAQRYGGKQFNVVGISTDDYRDRAAAFVQRFALSFPNFLDNELEMENMLGADQLPLTLLVDAKGKVLAKYYGARQWDSPESLALISKTLRVKL